jgi:hypothetical protein
VLAVVALVVVLIVLLSKGSAGASASYVQSYIYDQTGVETRCKQVEGTSWECASYDEPPSHEYHVTIGPNGTVSSYSGE